MSVEGWRNEETKESLDNNSSAVGVSTTSLSSRSSSATASAATTDGDVREILRMWRDSCERIA